MEQGIIIKYLPVFVNINAVFISFLEPQLGGTLYDCIPLNASRIYPKIAWKSAPYFVFIILPETQPNIL